MYKTPLKRTAGLRRQNKALYFLLTGIFVLPLAACNTAKQDSKRKDEKTNASETTKVNQDDSEDQETVDLLTEMTELRRVELTGNSSNAEDRQKNFDYVDRSLELHARLIERNLSDEHLKQAKILLVRNLSLAYRTEFQLSTWDDKTLSEKRLSFLKKIDHLTRVLEAEEADSQYAGQLHMLRIQSHLSFSLCHEELKNGAAERLNGYINSYSETSNSDSITVFRMYLSLARLAAVTGDKDAASNAYDKADQLLDEGLRSEELTEYFRKRLTSEKRNFEIVGQDFTLSGPTMSEEDFDISQLRGKVVIVDFWATWCGPCVRELPKLKNLLERYGDQGLEIVAVSLDRDRAALESFLQDNEQYNWTQVYHEHDGSEGWRNPLAERYGVRAIPTIYIVDRDGKLHCVPVRGMELEYVLTKLFAE